MDAHLFKGNVKRENVLFILKRTLRFALHDLLKNWGCIENDVRALLSRQLINDKV